MSQKKVTNRMMIDLETMGLVACAGWVTIGACVFNEEGILDEKYYCRIDPASCDQLGLKINTSTMEWWTKQKPEVLNELTDPNDRVSLREALEGLYAFYVKHNCKEIWSNGADFDIPMVMHVADCLGIKPPWEYWNHRCYRTLKSLFPLPKPEVKGACAHKAVDDAVMQAAHCMMILIWIQPAQVINQSDRDSMLSK